MVSIFGIGGRRGGRGPAGPVGPRGRSGQDGLPLLCQWLPNSMLRHIQEFDEKCCFLLENTEDIKKDASGVITNWKNRSHNGKSLEAVRGSKDIKNIEHHRYAIGFQNNSYKSDRILFDNLQGTGYLCITFKTNSDIRTCLLSNWRPHDRLFQNLEIMVDGETICVHGYESKKPTGYEISYATAKKFTTLFLEYNVKNHEIHFNYMLNADKDQSGNFLLSTPLAVQGGFSLGSRFTASSEQPPAFSGDIASLEMYFNESSQERFPPEIAMLISQKQKVKQFHGSVETNS